MAADVLFPKRRTGAQKRLQGDPVRVARGRRWSLTRFGRDFEIKIAGRTAIDRLIAVLAVVAVVAVAILLHSRLHTQERVLVAFALVLIAPEAYRALAAAWCRGETIQITDNALDVTTLSFTGSRWAWINFDDRGAVRVALGATGNLRARISPRPAVEALHRGRFIRFGLSLDLEDAGKLVGVLRRVLALGRDEDGTPRREAARVMPVGAGSGGDGEYDSRFKTLDLGSYRAGGGVPVLTSLVAFVAAYALAASVMYTGVIDKLRDGKYDDVRPLEIAMLVVAAVFLALMIVRGPVLAWLARLAVGRAEAAGQLPQWHWRPQWRDGKIERTPIARLLHHTGLPVSFVVAAWCVPAIVNVPDASPAGLVMAIFSAGYLAATAWFVYGAAFSGTTSIVLPERGYKIGTEIEVNFATSDAGPDFESISLTLRRIERARSSRTTFRRHAHLTHAALWSPASDGYAPGPNEGVVARFDLAAGGGTLLDPEHPVDWELLVEGRTRGGSYHEVFLLPVFE